MSVFFFNDTATTEIYTLSLHDALPILPGSDDGLRGLRPRPARARVGARRLRADRIPRARAHRPRGDGGAPPERRRGAEPRSEEHTSELQSRQYLVCRLLLEKKKTFLIISTILSDTPLKSTVSINSFPLSVIMSQYALTFAHHA